MKKIFFLLFILIALVRCQNSGSKEYSRIDGFTQGTTYSLTYHDTEKRDFSQQINIILEKIDSSMSLYRKNSVINAFNNSESGITIDSLLANVVNLSLLYYDQTDGAFDITVGPLVNAWGFHMKKGEFPTEEKINELLAFIGRDMISLEGNNLSKTNPQVKIDVNAIAQGYTVDVIAEFFEANGVKNYLVEVGGEIRSLGKSPRGKHWLVGVDKPEDNAVTGESLQVIIKLSGESMVTSGNYRKFFIREGVKYSHTIDPKTGYPVQHSLLSATVIDKTSARADALATAFMVMGTELTIEWLAKNPEVEGYLIFSNELGEYQVWMSESIKKRIVE
jgi:thiamine biosynthesis lipoprotein